MCALHFHFHDSVSSQHNNSEKNLNFLTHIMILTHFVIHIVPPRLHRPSRRLFFFFCGLLTHFSTHTAKPSNLDIDTEHTTSPDLCRSSFVFCDGRLWILGRSDLDGTGAHSCLLVCLTEGERWAYEEQKSGQTTNLTPWVREGVCHRLMYLAAQEEQKERQRAEGEERRIKRRWNMKKSEEGRSEGGRRRGPEQRGRTEHQGPDCLTEVQGWCQHLR